MRGGGGFLAITNGCACFSCFRVRSKNKFSVTQTERCNKESCGYHDRFCLDCGIKRKMYKPACAVFSPRMDDKMSDYNDCALCGSCNQLTFFPYRSTCDGCAEPEDGEDGPTGIIQGQCEHCLQGMESAAPILQDTCYVCAVRHCMVCKRSFDRPHGVSKRVCGDECRREGRRARMLARARAKKAGEAGKTKARGDSLREDVFEVEVEGALGLLQL